MLRRTTQLAQCTPQGQSARGRSVRWPVSAVAAAFAAPALVLLAGCGGSTVSAVQSNSAISISPVSATIDTNCTGCNAHSAHGIAVQQLNARLASGGPANVAWSISGGDAVSGAGTIDTHGEYTPPSYLTADRVTVRVTASLRSDPTQTTSTEITVTPGFLQPLTPQNAALGPGGSLTIAGTLAESGGDATIHFSLAGAPQEASPGQGALSATNCEHSSKTFTVCSVTYTAPASLSASSVNYIVARTGVDGAHTEAAVLLNTAGITSTPTSHQGFPTTPMLLGGSGGNNNDFDASGNTVVDCCSGTLGALVADSAGRQYLLSNNHVLARSDQASVGDSIVLPGLIDNNCTPNGDGPGTIPVGALTGWLPLSSEQTNVDAAIAQVASHTVDASGSILEFGARQPDGALAAAPPGISSSGGKGEAAVLDLQVAKSGRTTGLTCGEVSAVDVDVEVDYFTDCAETHPYLTKTFSHQIALSGNRFSDAGDSGALVVDSSNAEPVGLYFAGGIDAAGVSQGMANPAGEVLRELGAQLGAGMSYSFVGGADHPVSCLSFGDNTVTAAQARALSSGEIARVQQALNTARQQVNSANGVLGVAMGKSSDHPGRAAVVVYLKDGAVASIPATIDGVRTVIVPTTEHAVAIGTAPMTAPLDTVQPLIGAALSHAIAVKTQMARSLLRNRSFFAVGVGQSLDNPREPALVVYVDRRSVPAIMPATLDGVRVRYILMDRLHVARAYDTSFASRRHCIPHTSVKAFDPKLLRMPLPLL